MTRRRKRHSSEQIVHKLRDADAMFNVGKDLATVLQGLEVSRSTVNRWRNQFGRPSVEHPDPEVRSGGKLVSPSRNQAAVRVLCE